MSNKSEIQALNAKYESLIETLRGKAVGSGGSGGSSEGYRVAIGVADHDGIFASVSNLEFSPTFVAVFAASSITSAALGYDVIACEGVFEGETYSFRIGSGTALGGKSALIRSTPSDIELLENGFDWLLGDPPGTLMYIAIG